MEPLRRFCFSFVIVFATIATGGFATAAGSEPSPVPSPAASGATGSSPTPAARPSYASHWDFVEDDSLPIEVRHAAAMVDQGGGYVVFNATIDGKMGSFLLDTGAASIILSQRFAQSLNLPALGTTAYTGIAGNRIGAQVALVKDLGVGKSVLHDVVVDISENENADLGRRLDGTIGYLLFAKALVDVDLNAQRMRVYDPTRFEPTVTKKSYIFDIDLATRQPKIAGTIGNGIAIHPILDTGNALLLSLSDSLRDGNRLVATHAATMRFTGVDGRTEDTDCAHVTRVSFGPINYDGPIVCFFKAKMFGSDGGIVGFDFLQRFNWTIDYPDKKFVLTPNGL